MKKEHFYIILSREDLYAIVAALRYHIEENGDVKGEKKALLQELKKKITKK